MDLDMFGPPASEEVPAGMLVSEGLCPHCHDDLHPQVGWGWCQGCELGWRCQRSATAPGLVEIAVAPIGWPGTPDFRSALV